MSKLEKCYVIAYSVWFVTAIVEIVSILIFNSNSIVISETKNLPTFSFETDVILKWFNAYTAINEKLENQVLILFTVCVLLWVSAGILICSMIKKLFNTDAIMANSIFFIVVATIAGLVCLLLFSLVQSPIMFLVFALAAVSLTSVGVLSKK